MKRLNEQLKDYAHSHTELVKLKTLMQKKQNFSLFFAYCESTKQFTFVIR